MKVVLDTNVLLSAILFGGIPGRILDAWRAGQVELVMSPDIVDEYVRVGERLNGRYPDVEIQPVVALVVQNATIVPSAPLPGAVCDDPDDDKFLACASAGGVQAVVSGDKDLLSLSEFRNIPILTPRQFVESYLLD